jgi:ATP-dependent RNA helicase RhlE
VDEHKLLKDIERLIKRSLPMGSVAGFEPDPHARPQPIQQRQGSRPQGSARGNAPAQAKPGRPGQAPSKAVKSAKPGNGSARPAGKQPMRGGSGKSPVPALQRAQRRQITRGDGV